MGSSGKSSKGMKKSQRLLTGRACYGKARQFSRTGRFVRRSHQSDIEGIEAAHGEA